MKMGWKNLLRNQIVKNINSFTKVAVYTKSCVWKKKSIVLVLIRKGLFRKLSNRRSIFIT